MAVLDFAAHFLDYQILTGGGEDPKTGDYIDGKRTWVNDAYRCDIVPAGKANQISIPDGAVQTYSYTVYNLPNDCREFQYGDKIRISFYGKRPGKVFTVLGFHRYQHQCKVWI